MSGRLRPPLRPAMGGRSGAPVLQWAVEVSCCVHDSLMTVALSTSSVLVIPFSIGAFVFLSFESFLKF